MSERRLYGVHHDFEWVDVMLETHRTRIPPSLELISYLESLPPNTSVGIEACEELFEAFYSDGSDPEVRHRVWDLYSSIGSKPIQDFYWREIAGVCLKSGLKIEFLDDFEMYKKYFAKLSEEHELKESVRYPRPSEEEPLTKQELDEAVFRAKSEALYILTFGRENRIIENILLKKPQVIIVGIGHAGEFYFGENTLYRQGFQVGRYLEEQAGLRPDRPVVVPNGRDASIWVERERIMRNYNASTHWRIHPRLKSDYIGTFNQKCRPAGLFEIVSTKDGIISGWKHDVVGTGTVQGEDRGDTIEFTCVYDKHWTEENREGFRALKNPVVYTGKFDGEKFRGEWASQKDDGSMSRGSFILFRGREFKKDA